jgi:hypothetical protein
LTAVDKHPGLPGVLRHSVKLRTLPQDTSLRDRIKGITNFLWFLPLGGHFETQEQALNMCTLKLGSVGALQNKTKEGLFRCKMYKMYSYLFRISALTTFSKIAYQPTDIFWGRHSTPPKTAAKQNFRT